MMFENTDRIDRLHAPKNERLDHQPSLEPAPLDPTDAP
jgi:hypothetical protein